MIVAKKVNLLYWDMNNLYGFAMNQLLPYGDFNFLVYILLVKIVQQVIF